MTSLTVYSPAGTSVCPHLTQLPPSFEGFRELYQALLDGAAWHQADHYFVLKDFSSYLETKIRAISDTADPHAFARKCLMNVAHAGLFSSDRTVREYADKIWKI